jgi:hypothetical protein
VGKSTLLQNLGLRGKDAHGTIWGQPVLPLLGQGLQLLPTLFGLWSHSGSLLWHESRHVVRLANLHRALCRRELPQGRVVIFDEGPIFALAWLRGFGHEIMRSEATDEWWRATLRDWGALLDAVVVLDAPDSLLAQRIRSRPHPHEMKQASDLEISVWTARFREALDWVLEAMAGNGGPLVLRVENHQERPDALANLVGAALDRMPYDD